MKTIFRKALRDKEFKLLDKEVTGSWVHVVSDDALELKSFAEDHDLEPATFLDCLDDHEIPRIEYEDNAIYVMLNVPLSEQHRVVTRPLLVVIMDKLFITVSKRNLSLIDALSRQKSVFTTQKTKLLLNIFSSIGRSYELYLNRISKELKSKRLNLKQLTDEDVIRLVELEETLNDFNSSFGPVTVMLSRMLNGKRITLFKEDKELVEDLIIDSQQIVDMTRTSIKSSANIREAYSTVLSNKLNNTLKFLAVMTIILTLPTIIASIYGMNIDLPFQHDHFAFVFVLGVIVSLVVVSIVVLRKKRWL